MQWQYRLELRLQEMPPIYRHKKGGQKVANKLLGISLWAGIRFINDFFISKTFYQSKASLRNHLKTIGRILHHLDFVWFAKNSYQSN